MILDLCENMEELEYELNKQTNGGSIKKKYKYLAEYMKLLGGHSIGIVSEEEKYYLLKKSFLEGNWRTINGEY